MNFDWIPQIFMDVIGRVLPGALTLIACVFVCQGPSHAIDTFTKDGSTVITWPSFLFWSLVSYLIGFSLTPIWRHTLGKISKQREEMFGIGGAVNPKVCVIGELVANPPLDLAKLGDRAIVHECEPACVERMAVRFGVRKAGCGADVRQYHRAAADAREVQQVDIVPCGPDRAKEGRLRRDVRHIPGNAKAIAIERLFTQPGLETLVDD